MNDEIKEILDNIKKCCDITKDQSFIVYQRQDILKLLDYITNLQSKIDKINELIERKLSTETYQHLKELYDDIDSVEKIWEDYEFEDLLDILKESEESGSD